MPSIVPEIGLRSLRQVGAHRQTRRALAPSRDRPVQEVLRTLVQISLKSVPGVAFAFVERVAAASPVRMVSLPWAELFGRHLDRRHRAVLQLSIKSPAGNGALAGLAGLVLRQTLYLLVVEDGALRTAQHQHLDLHVAFVGTLVEQVTVFRMSSESGWTNQHYLLVG